MKKNQLDNELLDFIRPIYRGEAKKGILIFICFMNIMGSIFLISILILYYRVKHPFKGMDEKKMINGMRVGLGVVIFEGVLLIGFTVIICFIGVAVLIMKALMKYIKSGEVTHGNVEFQQLKLNAFKQMVENYGIKAFALDANPIKIITKK